MNRKIDSPHPGRLETKPALCAKAAILVAVLLGACSHAFAADFFVSPIGNDLNPGTIDQPFRTIQKCATSAPSGSTCQIRAGTYPETVTPNSGIVITAYNGETVTVDGTDPVTGWTVYRGSIYRVSAALSSDDSNQVFVGREMMTEARWPNGDDLFHPNWAVAQPGTTPTELVDPSLPAGDWRGARVHIWSGNDPWSPLTAVVTTAGSGRLTLSLDAAALPPYFVLQPGGVYHLFGALAALDVEREWHYDRSSQTLYFWAPGGVDPNTLDVRVKRRGIGFDLSGRTGVTIRGVQFFATTIATDFGSASATLDGIRATYLSHYTQLPDNPTNPGNGAWTYTVASGIVLKGSGHTLKNSILAWSAGNGVALVGNDSRVENNLIHHIGYMADDTAGVVAHGSGHTVTRNTIHTGGRFLVLLKPFYDRSAAPMSDLDVSYNNIYQAMTMSRDASAIYSGGPPVVLRSRIHHNWIHDNMVLAGPTCPWCNFYTLGGIYLDSNASGWVVDQNVLWNSQNHSIFVNGDDGGFNPGPNNNLIADNSIFDVGARAYIWLSDVHDCGTTQLLNNRVFVPMQQTFSSSSGTPCSSVNNNAMAPGATEMTSAVQVGCNFAGCSSVGPPMTANGLVAASIATKPNDIVRLAGQTATFTVTAGGSPPFSYQWQRNGLNISDAIQASYTTPPLSLADSGSGYSVSVENALGKVDSAQATLTVRRGATDCLFDWAEKNFPSLFYPAAGSQVSAPYYYRRYSSTNAYLGVSSLDSHIYYLAGGVLNDVGPASTWYVTSGCQ